jgi:hypothetical protein
MLTTLLESVKADGQRKFDGQCHGISGTVAIRLGGVFVEAGSGVGQAVGLVRKGKCCLLEVLTSRVCSAAPGLQ